MARPRKSATILKATGAFKKNPGRTRVDTPGVGIIGDHPDCLDELETELWNRIKTMVPPGVVTGSDELIMETLARYWARLRRTPSEEISGTQVAQIINCCNALCMSPQSRTKIQAPEKKKSNPFEGF